MTRLRLLVDRAYALDPRIKRQKKEEQQRKEDEKQRRKNEVEKRKQEQKQRQDEEAARLAEEKQREEDEAKRKQNEVKKEKEAQKKMIKFVFARKSFSPDLFFLVVVSEKRRNNFAIFAKKRIISTSRIHRRISNRSNKSKRWSNICRSTI